MNFLFLMSLVFSTVTVTDNCNTNFCKVEVKNGDRLLRRLNSLPNSKKSTWHTSGELSNPDATEVVYSDAGADGKQYGKLALGRQARKVSQDILDIIAGHNLGLNLTTAQINQLKITYAAAKSCLDDNQPWCAKTEIDKISVNEPVVTQELLDQINTIFSESGLPGL